MRVRRTRPPSMDLVTSAFTRRSIAPTRELYVGAEQERARVGGRESGARERERDTAGQVERATQTHLERAREREREREKQRQEDRHRQREREGR